MSARVTRPRGRAVQWWLAGALLVVPGAAQAQQYQPDNCAACHEAMPDERLSAPALSYAEDVHAQRGFGCVACHGGDANEPGMEGMDPARGFVARPSGRVLLQTCGSCHSNAETMRRYNPSLRVDQVAEYVTSVHGQRLLRNGDPAVATCKSCHPAHQIRPPSDPRSSVHPRNVAATCGHCHADTVRMASYRIPTDQLQKYRRSVHWHAIESGDLSAPTCNDCHGNHGAAPPGISWVGNVCGQCHATMADRFRSSRHAVSFAARGTPGCAACHGNHEIGRVAIGMLGMDSGSVCVQCHVATDQGGLAAVEMRRLLDSLDDRFDAAHGLLTRAEQAGVEVSQALFELEAARNARVAARTAVHGMVLDSVRTEVGTGLEVTEAGVAAGQRALRELTFRRTGLAVSVAFIVALIVGLVAKIRQMDRSTGAAAVAGSQEADDAR